MKIASRWGFLLLIMVTIFSCKDILEEDISFDIIKLNAPANDLQTVEVTHTFWWDDMDDADQNNIQIVEGTFSSVSFLVLDSILGSNKFDATLYPGNFQWRVKGINNGSETIFSTFSFIIDSTNDASTQTVILTSPTDDLITNMDSITFRWNELYIADSYNFDIRENDWNGSSVFGVVSTTLNEYSAKLSEGIYEWGVQAENQASNTFSGFSQRSLIVDVTPPDSVALGVPLDFNIIGDSNFTFTWTHPTIDNGTTIVKDSIFFYTDVNGVNELLRDEGIQDSYTDSLGIINIPLFWRVRSSDEAGNHSKFSTMRTFVIQ